MPQFGFGFGFGFRKGVDNKTFISTWKTDNTGTSNDNQITLPLLSSGTYDFTVDWGDGNTDTITAYDDAAVTHTYASAGTYTVSISGICDGFSFNNGGDKDKITEISNWGSLAFGAGGTQFFFNATNLDVTATDAPDLTGVTNLGLSFNGINSFTGSMARFDFSDCTNTANMFAYTTGFTPSDIGSCLSTMGNVERAYRMFKGCTNFNADVSDLDISSMTTGASNGMSEFLDSTNLSTDNYDAFLISMAEQAPTAASSLLLGASGLTYSAAASAARTTLTSTYGWTITDGGLAS